MPIAPIYSKTIIVPALGITYFINTLNMAFIPAMKEMDRTNAT